MKLIDNLKYTYDDVNKEYVFEVDKTKKPKKVSSRMFPILRGKNSFNSVGYGLLDRFRLLEFEGDIDVFYKIRGAVGEYFIEKELHKQFSMVEGFETKRFYTSQFKHMDQFHEDYKWGNTKYGGSCDIAIAKPKTLKAVVECKSKGEFTKEMGKPIPTIEWLEKKLNVESIEYHDEECMQGLHLGVLSKVSMFLMAYAIFPDVVAEKLKQFDIITDKIKKTTDLVLKEGGKVIKHYDRILEEVEDDMVEAILDYTQIKQEDIIYKFKKFNINQKRALEEMELAHETLYRNFDKESGKLTIHAVHLSNEEKMVLDAGLKTSDTDKKEKDPFEDLPF